MKGIQNNLAAFLIPALLLLVLTHTAEAQIKSDTSNVVIIDFEKKTIERPEKLNFHDFYHVKIKNINLNLYDVKVNNKDSTISSGMKFPSFESIVLDGISDLIGNLAPLGLSMLPESMNNKGLDSTLQVIHYVNVTMATNKDKLINTNNELKVIAHKIDSLALSVQTLSLSYLAVNSTLRNKLEKDLSYEIILKDSETYREEIALISKNLITSEKAYREYSKKYSDFFRSHSDSSLIKFDKEIKELYAKISGNVDKVFAGVSAERVGGWLESLIHRENNSSTVYKSQPFQITGDYSELIVTITPKSEDYGLPSFINKYHLPKPPRFYIGGGAAFYYSPNMRNDAFSISSTKIDSVTTKYTLVDEEQPNGEIGISSVIQFGWAFGANRRGNVHLTLGPAASIGKTIKPRLLTGIGIGYGRKQKVSVSYGLLMGHSDRLSNVFETGTVVNEKPDQVVVSEFQRRGVFSIGYIFNF